MAKEVKKEQKQESVLKNLTLGMEAELFTLDSKGSMANGADRLIRKVKGANPQIGITHECGKNMVEISTFPHAETGNVMLQFLDDFEAVLHCAEKEGLALYSYGTYPGSFTPEINTDKGYIIKEQIFGKARFSIAARCIGLHCHYSLPWGVFDHKRKVIKPLINSKNKQSMIDNYNLFIAMDPAITTFAQSSPFYQGSYLGKDSRIIVYRGGKIFNYLQGLYANHQDFGMLQPYKATGTDLLQIIWQRFDLWTGILKNLDMSLKVFLKHGSILDTTWNPVKISSHGTIEQRGMDMNRPQVVIAIAALIKAISKEVQDRFMHVLPSDIGVAEPFKQEGNIIHIPPHTHVRFELQPKAAYHGLDDKNVYAYCSGLLKLGKGIIPRKELPLIAPLEKMISEKKTASDYLIRDAKKLGVSLKTKMTNKQAAELALRHSRDLFRDIIMTKQAIKKLV
ncbi:hypothetical protein J4212_00820 [Candidatus Woesearchaeota archaeon]|nr:hypothetical protein [Candidatus Woesearchaeota archaeon]